MFGNSSSPKARLSIALGLLLASVAGPAIALEGRSAEVAAGDRFELIPAERASQLPAELRVHEGAPSISEALGLSQATGSHTVQLRWVVRENRAPSGYRVTLVAADGLPGHLSARWWVSPAQGTPIADGLTAYSAEISLALDGQTPVAAAIEAVDAAGQTMVLGVRHAIAEADPGPRHALRSRPEAISANPTVLLANRLAPSARAATASAGSIPPPGALVASAPTAFLAIIDPDGAVSPRGPPTERITA